MPATAATMIATESPHAPPSLHMVLSGDDPLYAIPQGTIVGIIDGDTSISVDLATSDAPFRLEGLSLVTTRQIAPGEPTTWHLELISKNGATTTVKVDLPLTVVPSAPKAMVGNEVFLQGSYVEVGMGSGGNFGTSAAAPSDYHPIGRTTLGFVADFGRDGWAVGSPQQTGDYFLPGSPFEGWSVEWDAAGTFYGNFGGTTQNFPMIAVTETSNGTTESLSWIGEKTVGSDSLRVLQNVSFEQEDLFFVMSVTLENIGSTTLNGVRYLRSVDPDQERDLPDGDYSTINSVHYQPGTEGNPDRALVVAKGQMYGLTLGLGTFDSRAKVTTESPWPQDPDDVLNSPNAPTPSSPETADAAIALAFSLGNLAPGQTVSFSYAYILNENDLDVALGSLEAVTILQPGGTISGTNVPFHATTNDPADTTQIEFFVNGASIGIDTSPDAGGMFGVTFNSTDFPNGTQFKFLQATATFADGSTASKSTTVTIANSGPPVEFVTPTSGQSVDGANLPIEVAGTDPLHVPVSVRFFRETSGTGSIFLGEVTSAPFSTTYDTSDLPTDETVVLKAFSSDSVGNETVIYTSVTTAINYPPTDITLDSTSVPENSAGSTLVGTLNTVDPNTWDSFAYQLLDSAGGLFQVVGDQLQVAPGADLNFEVTNSYSIQVRSTDTGGQQVTKTFTVTITNMPEPLISVANLEVDESVGAAGVVLTLVDSSASPTSVTCSTLDGTAIAGEDYSTTSTVVTWPGGAAGDQSCLVPILDDNLDGPVKAFIVILSAPVNGEITDGTATVTINDDDASPVAVDDSYPADEDTLLDVGTPGVLDNDSDGDGDALTAVLDSGPTHESSFSLNSDGSFSYRSAADWYGIDSFTYHVHDGHGNESGTATVTINVANTDDPPVLTASGDANTYIEDQPAITIDSAITLVDIDGPDMTGAKISISGGFVPGEDMIDYTTTAGITGSYQSSTGILTLSGSASASDYQAAFRAVKYRNSNSALPNTGDRTVNFSVGESTLYYEGNGHYYEFVTSNGISWYDARTAAEARSFHGLQGYLVTVTSSGENSFVASKLQGTGWLGATDASDEAACDQWTWVTGPEAGTQFWQGDGSGSTVGDMYANWFPIEPNDWPDGSCGGEDHGHFLSGGQWNDFRYDNSSIQGYAVEYGGMSGDPPALELSADVTVHVQGVNDDPVAVNDSTSVPEDSAVTVNVLTNDSDPDLDPLTVTSVTQGSHGVVTFTSSSVTFTPTPNYNGPDSFTYTVEDGQGGSAVGTVDVTVTPVPDISVGDVAQAEGSSGETTAFIFTVTLDDPASDTVQVPWYTADGTALAGEDYTAGSGTLTMTIGQSSGTITVNVAADDDYEVDETYEVNLGTPVNAALSDSQGVGSILNDDPQPGILVNDPIVTEATGSDVTMVFTVSLDRSSVEEITVSATTLDGNAEAGSDYQQLSATTVTFAAGETTKTLSVTVLGDNLDEPDETFHLNLSGPTNGTVADSTGIGTIIDDDPIPGITISDITVDETDPVATLTLTLTNLSQQEVSVSFDTANGTALAGTDYTATTTTVTWTAMTDGDQTVDVPIINDFDDDNTEIFVVNLSNPVNATIADDQATVTIEDDDLIVNTTDDHNDGTCTSSDCSLREAILAANARPQDDIIRFGIPSGMAVGGIYTIQVGGTTGSLGALPMVTDQVVIDGASQPDFVDVPIVELDGTLAGFGKSGLWVIAGSTTIRSLVINRFEGHGLNFTSSGNNEIYGCRIGVNAAGNMHLPNGGNGIYFRNVGSNTVGSPTAGDGNLIAANGQSGVTIESALSTGNTVQGNIIGLGADGTTQLGNGRQGIYILGASGNTIGGLGSNLGNVIASNNVNGVLVTSGTGNIIHGNQIFGNTQLAIDLSNDGVTLNDPLDTDNGANDLQNFPTLQRVTAGSSSTGIVGDLGADASTDYLLEFFANSNCDVSGYGEAEFVVWSTTVTTDSSGLAHFESSTATLVTSGLFLTATATDQSGNTSELSACGEVEPVPTVTIGDVSVTELDSGAPNIATFTVTLDRASALPATVAWTTVQGTAASGADFSSGAGTLTFVLGETSKTIEITIIGDDIDEFDEVFTVALSNPTDCAIADGVGEGLILDQDDPPTFSIDDTTVTEVDSGSNSTATFTINLSTDSGKPINLDFATVDGIATADADYTAISGSLDFAIGETTKTVDVTVTGDDIDEFDETFTVELSNPSNVNPGDASGTGTITDNDETPTVSVDDVTVTEGDSGTTVDAIFTISLSAESGKPINLNWESSDLEATAPADYLPGSGEFAFSPGETTKTFTITVIGDDEDESDHDYAVTLSALVNVEGDDLEGMGTITDDDADVTITKTDGLEQAVPGEVLTYTLVVTNPGHHLLNNVVVADTLPTALQNPTWTCTPAGSAHCDVTSGSGSIMSTVDLPAGAGAIFEIRGIIDPGARGTITNTATVELPAGLLDDPVLDNNSATDETTLVPEIDLSILKTDDVDPVIAGTQLLYSLAVNNVGPSDATGVEVVDTLPEGVTFVSGSPGCAEDLGIVTCTVGDLAAGAGAILVITVDVHEDTRGLITNTGSINGIEEETDPANDSDDEETMVEASADLKLTKTAPVSVTRGETFYITLEIENLGQSDAFEVIVDDPTPLGLTLGSVSKPCGDGFPCELGTVEAAETRSLTISLTIPVDYAGPDPIINIASVSSTTADPDPNNNLATTTTAVDRTPEADLTITKTGPPTVAPGSLLTWSLATTNNGPDAATDTEVIDTLPAELVYVSSSMGCAESAGIVTCAVGELPVGETRTMTVSAMAPGDYSGADPIINEAATLSSVTDPDPLNNSDTAETAVGEDTIDLEVVKSAPTTADGGETITYTLSVVNRGPATAIGVVASDVLPADVAFVDASAGCVEGGGQVDCNFGDMASGAILIATIDVEVMSVSGVIENTATVTAISPMDSDPSNNESTATTGVGDIPADVSIRVSGPSEAVPGRELTATVVVTNNGPGPASGVSLEVPVPTGLSELGVTAPCASGMPCMLNELTAGSSRIVNITYHIPSDYVAPDPVEITGTVTTVSTDSNPSNDMNTALAPVLRIADLSLDLIDTPDPVVAGTGPGNLNYTLVLANSGPADASAITVDLSILLPAGVGLDAVLPNSGSWAAPTWTVPSLPAGSQTSLGILQTVGETALAGSMVSVTATVTGAAEVLTDIGDDTAVESTLIETQTDLEIEKSDSEDPLTSGSTLVYSLEVTNNGPSNSIGFSVVDVLPDNVVLVSMTSGCVDDEGTVTCKVGPLTVGASAVFDIEVTVEFSVPIMSNTATVEMDQNDPDPSNNSDTETTSLDNNPPRVEYLLSDTADEDGTLDDCDTVYGEISSIGIVFSEVMTDLPGDDQWGDVTNPGSFLIVNAGPDFKIDTSFCGGVQGDDIAIPIDEVVWDEGSLTATLYLANNFALLHDQHRLILCAESLKDSAGNPLNGNEDGTIGDDWVVTFRVDKHNLLKNGHLDCNDDTWIGIVTIPEEIEWVNDDAHGAPLSGSVHLRNLSGLFFMGLSECIEIGSSLPLTLSTMAIVEEFPNNDAIIELRCVFFGRSSCDGVGLDQYVASFPFDLGDPGGTWKAYETDLQSSVGSVSAACGAFVSTFEKEIDFGVTFDSIHLLNRTPDDDSLIFASGFESGDVSAWSSFVN